MGTFLFTMGEKSSLILVVNSSRGSAWKKFFIYPIDAMMV